MRTISNKIGLALFFMISPLLCLFIAIKSYRTNWSKNIIWAFAVFFGFTFVISNEGMDAYEYAKKLTEMHASSLSYTGLVANFYNGEEAVLDFIQPLLTFLVSLFTDNYHVLYAVFCLVFGFFYSRNIWMILTSLKGKLKPEILFLVFLFALIIPLWSVNGVRMYTAAHMFFYGLLPFLLYNKKQNLIWCVMAIFMHFSFIFPLVIVALYILLGNRTDIYFWIFIISSLVIQSAGPQITGLMENYLPAIFQKRFEGYTNEEYTTGAVQLFAENNFYAIWYEPLLRWAISILLILAYVKGKRFFIAYSPFHKLIAFTFLFYSMSNIVAGIPSFGRFVTIANLFALACIIYYLHYSKRPALFKMILPSAYAIMVFYMIVSFRMGFDTIGLMTVIGNPVTALINDTEVALIQLIK